MQDDPRPVSAKNGEAAMSEFMMYSSLLAVLGFLGGCVCLLLALVRMFQRGRAGLAITCIALSAAGGLGGLIAFVYGWTNVDQWGIKRTMTTWAICWGAAYLLAVLLLGIGCKMWYDGLWEGNHC
jgi:hypothetical protein